MDYIAPNWQSFKIAAYSNYSGYSFEVAVFDFYKKSNCHTRTFSSTLTRFNNFIDGSSQNGSCYIVDLSVDDNKWTTGCEVNHKRIWIIVIGSSIGFIIFITCCCCLVVCIKECRTSSSFGNQNFTRFQPPPVNLSAPKRYIKKIIRRYVVEEEIEVQDY